MLIRKIAYFFPSHIWYQTHKQILSLDDDLKIVIIRDLLINILA